ncbi:AAA+ family ATPase [Halovivax ruber XH-70]|uniref:AAA+ family ATPase n=1 Tax=Halovivax ruber (strain DSM 18193 / JCM 13892 / XH-70) TaxID=797302 RepID=L0IAB3_HALRX|nr:AAA family ATPase [Halovivax ruber]AGB14872.1 AAA+ family ATPase [Halovivax ruber XH-70]
MYERDGDHLQAEFDRILVALNALTDRDLRPADESIDLPDAEPDKTGTKRPDPLTNVGATLQSITGHPDQGSDESTGATDLTDVLTELAAEIDHNCGLAREAGLELRLDSLARSLNLSRIHLDALLLALAPELDWRIASIYGLISGMEQPLPAQISVLETVLGRMGHGTAIGDSSPKEALATAAPLFGYRLFVRHSGNPGTPSAYDTVTVDERIVDYLKGDDSLDRALADLVSIDHPDSSLSDLVFDDETTETLETIRSRSEAADAPTIYHFAGEDGTGKDRLPAALTDADTPILRADAIDIVEDDDLCTRLIREGALQDAAIHLTGLERVTERTETPAIGVDEDGGVAMPDPDAPTVDSIVERFDDAPGDVFLSHTEAWKPDVDLARHHVETVHCQFPGYSTRLAIWEEYADEIAEDYLVENVATNFRLPQRDIRRAVKTARYLCRSEQGIVDASEESASTDAFAPVDAALEREHLYAACKRYSASNLEALADRMEPGYELDDLYLNDKPKTHLRELCGHLQYRGAVTSEWGFGEPGSRGDGVVALFYGQPGTGKTMAAEVIANETGLDLYRVDLAQIVDKYIGETESQLAALLDEAERSNAILLFDEADSLFGERTDVGDATDRHANNVTNFLLQRLESFDGIALLTTNKRGGIDSAFKRRIAHSIRFDVPQEDLRRRLWRESFPDEANVATDDFDFDFLGMKTLTPAIIRKVAKYAAYIAATEAYDGQPLDGETTSLEDVTITFDHIILGLQYASEAGGVALQDDEFYQYEERLRTYETKHVSRDFDTRFRMRYLDGEGLEDVANGDDGDESGEVGGEAEDGGGKPTEDTRAESPNKESDATDDDASESDKKSVDSENGPTRIADDSLTPEAVVRHFYDRVRAQDRAGLSALYHPDAEAEILSKRDVMAMDLSNVELASSIERIVDEDERVVLEFVEASNTHELPTEIECQADDAGRWRLYTIRQDAPAETT